MGRKTLGQEPYHLVGDRVEVDEREFVVTKVNDSTTITVLPWTWAEFRRWWKDGSATLADFFRWVWMRIRHLFRGR